MRRPAALNPCPIPRRRKGSDCVSAAEGRQGRRTSQAERIPGRFTAALDGSGAGGQVLRQGHGDGRGSAAASKSVGAAADLVERVFHDCGFFRDRDGREGVGTGIQLERQSSQHKRFPNLIEFWSYTKDSYMATITLPEAEVQEKKNRTNRPQPSTSTRSAAARPTATAK